VTITGAFVVPRKVAEGLHGQNQQLTVSALDWLQPRNRWRTSDYFYFQKGLKGPRKLGHLIERFPIEKLSDLVARPRVDSYDQISALFDRFAARVVDPGAALLPIPAYLLPVLRTLAPPPAENSSELAAELVELFWAAALRDVPFDAYSRSDQCTTAAKELAELGLIQQDDPEKLFAPRSSSWPGQTFPSQFFTSPTREWPRYAEQKYPAFAEGRDYLTDKAVWQHAQSGEASPGRFSNLDPNPKPVNTGRCLASLVYRDHPTQFFVSACLQLYEFNNTVWSVQKPFRHQDGIAPFLLGGLPHALSCISRCVELALRLCWHAKWGTFMYPRPEEVAYWCGEKANRSLARVSDILLNSKALALVRLKTSTSQTSLLPQVYPDGAPLHPSYPAGHAVAAGAAITAIKAFIRPNASFPASSVGSNGISPLSASVNTELNKLAWSVAFGRSFAGIHYRGDCEAGINLGEEVALHLLRQEKKTYPISYNISIIRFDGRSVRI